MKKVTSLKIGALALCLLGAPHMSAAAPAATAVSKLATKVAKAELHKFFATPKGIATLSFMLSLYIFFSREPDNAPNRYDLEKFKTNPLDLMNYYYFYWDGIWGNRRQSSSARIGADGKLELKPGAPARGLGGMISEMVRPLESTFNFIDSTERVAMTILAGMIAWGVAEDIV